VNYPFKYHFRKYD